MKRFIFILAFTILQANSLRLVEDYYDNRIPKKIYTNKETSNKIILKTEYVLFKKEI
jgi:hypothetical protein